LARPGAQNTRAPGLCASIGSFGQAASLALAAALALLLRAKRPARSRARLPPGPSARGALRPPAPPQRARAESGPPHKRQQRRPRLRGGFAPFSARSGAEKKGPLLGPGKPGHSSRGARCARSEESSLPQPQRQRIARNATPDEISCFFGYSFRSQIAARLRFCSRQKPAGKQQTKLFNGERRGKVQNRLGKD